MYYDCIKRERIRIGRAWQRRYPKTNLGYRQFEKCEQNEVSWAMNNGLVDIDED